MSVAKMRFGDNALLASIILFAMFCIYGVLPAAAKPELKTNQSFIEDLHKADGPDIKDLKSTLEFVLGSLPDEVVVYPTENYYYFSFYTDGVRYAGNLRLATRDRDQGIIHFAYFASANSSSDDGEMFYKPLTAKDGVTVKKIDDLRYSVSFKNKTVTFRFNDVSGIKPPKDYLLPEEQYLGPVYDESGLQFYLVFNKKLKIFHYLLNEAQKVPEDLQVSTISENLLVGKRTGFVFYKHHTKNRKVLIGIHQENAAVNNYYDGPFDQLPDNLNKDDTLKNAIVAADPSSKDQLDRFGYLKSGEGRYLIGPYLQYTDINEMKVFDDCAVKYKDDATIYNGCFAVQGGGEENR